MILLTGGSGLLGQELIKLLKEKKIEFVAPTHQEMNIVDYVECWKSFVLCPHKVIHCAAFAEVAKSEVSKEEAYRINCEGTANIVRLCRKYNVPMTYLSTDYVFAGTKKDPYVKEDIIDPISYYGFTKAIGEEIVKTLYNYQIIRTGFKPSKWKHKTAPEDQITTADYVDIIAPLILDITLSNLGGIFHVGTEIKTTYELALRRNKKIKSIKVNDIKDVKIPRNAVLK